MALAELKVALAGASYRDSSAIFLYPEILNGGAKLTEPLITHCRNLSIHDQFDLKRVMTQTQIPRCFVHIKIQINFLAL